MEPQKPSIGRIVHYVSYGTPGGEFQSECRAAVITAVGTVSISNEDGSNGQTDDLAVDLCVLNPTGLFFNQGVGYNDEKTGGTWHWPERV